MPQPHSKHSLILHFTRRQSFQNHFKALPDQVPAYREDLQPPAEEDLSVVMKVTIQNVLPVRTIQVSPN